MDERTAPPPVPAEADPLSARVVFVVGGARSGTTWLAKILDSHPDVLYRHEPDIVLRAPDLPSLCDDADIPRLLPAARRYFESLLDVRTLKSAGSMPVFAKSFQPGLVPKLRQAVALGLKAMEQVPPLKDLSRRLPIPDLADWRSRPEIRLVVKSVSSLGRLNLMAAAMPGARFVMIVRHPCGQIASSRRGEALGKFEDAVHVDHPPPERYAARYGLDAARFAALSRGEKHAWHWALLNERAMEALDATGRGMVIRYEDLCADPEARAREILDFAGLAWNPQTERFLRASTTYSGADRYYQIFKNTNEAVNRWRSEMPVEDQRAIIEAIRDTRAGRLFAEERA